METREVTAALYWVRARCLAEGFPPPHDALEEPNGLLAIGGDLAPARLVTAYRQGIFPWFTAGQPVMWWSPQPRTVLQPTALHVGRSLAKRVRNGGFLLSHDAAFDAVVAACAAPRGDRSGTWITAAMADAYGELHHHGIAHSVECWQGGGLVGGLYGVALGRVFFGESMFSRARDASKVALVALCRRLVAWHYELVDCQMPTAHLASLGARALSRAHFTAALARLVDEPVAAAAWALDGRRPAALT